MASKQKKVFVLFNAYQIFQSSKVETKREILHILLSNLKLQDRKISYTLRKPYDYIRSLNKKIPSKTEGIAIGDPNGRPQKKQPVAVFSRRRNETC